MRIQLLKNPASRNDVEVVVSEHTGQSVEKIFKSNFPELDFNNFIASVSGGEVDWDYIPKESDEVLFVADVKSWPYVGYMILSAVISYGISRLMTPDMPENTKEDSKTYSFDGIKNLIGDGNVVPIVYGRHRVGGIVIMGYISGGRTTEEAKILLALSEGEISDINAPSILVKNKSIASWNAVSVQSTLGSNTQNISNSLPDTSLPAWADSVPSEFTTITHYYSDGAEITNAAPYTYVTTNSVKSVAISMKFPSLFKTNDKGSINYQTVEFYLQYRRKGTTDTWQNCQWTLSDQYTHDGIYRAKDKTRSETIKRFHVVFATEDEYEIRITRNTEDFDDSKNYGDSYIKGVVEHESGSVTYPNTALLGLSIRANEEISGSVPNVSVEIEGKLIKDVRTDTISFSSNPANIIYDILINKRHGLGRFGITEENIDIDSLRDYADFCDELVDYYEYNPTTENMDLKQEKRFEVGLVIDKEYDGFEMINMILNACRGLQCWEGEKFKVVIERDESPTQMFNMSNIVSDSFFEEISSLQDVPNQINIDFNDEDDEYKKTTISIIDPDRLDETIVSKKLKLFGLTKQSRIKREMAYYMRKATGIRSTIEFEASLKAVRCQAGDVIYFQHDTPAYGVGGKIETTVGMAEFVADRDLGIYNNVSVRIELPNGDMAVRNCDVDGTSVTLDSPIPGLAADSIYSISASGIEAKPYRIMSIERGSDGDTIKIIAVEHIADIYNDSTSIEIDRFNYSLLPHLTSAAYTPEYIQTVDMYELLRLSGNILQSHIYLSWAEPPNLPPNVTIQFYEVLLSSDGGETWEIASKVYGTSYETVALHIGETYHVCIKPYTNFDVTNNIEYSGYALDNSITLEGKTAAPISPDSITVNVVDDYIHKISWGWPDPIPGDPLLDVPFIPEKDVVAVELWRSTGVNDRNDPSFELVGTSMHNSLEDITYAAMEDTFYWVRSLDSTGFYGEWFPYSETGGEAVIAHPKDISGSAQGKFTSLVFKRSATQPTTPDPTEGEDYNTYAHPYPNPTEGWSDGIPAPDGNPLWVALRQFTTDGLAPQALLWTEPVLYTQNGDNGDGTRTRYIFSSDETAPDLPPNNIEIWPHSVANGTWDMANSENSIFVSWQVNVVESDGVTVTDYGDWITPIKIKGEKGDAGQLIVRSFVFTRSATEPEQPVGGTLSSPIPTNTDVTWTDGIPSDSGLYGDAKTIWFTGRTFTSDEQPPHDANWVAPIRWMGSNFSGDVRYLFSSDETPQALPEKDRTAEDSWPYNGWNLDPDETTIWAVLQNNKLDSDSFIWHVIEYGDWSTPVRIKGEKGEAGAAATGIVLSSDRQVFRYANDGSPDPASQVANIHLDIHGIAGTPVFACETYDSDGTLLSTPTLAGSGSDVTLTVAQFDSAAYAIVTSTLDVYSDTMTLFRVQDGAEGIHAMTLVLSNEAHIIPTDENGNNPDYAGSGTQIMLYEGASELEYDGIGNDPGKWKFAAISAQYIDPPSYSKSGNAAVVNQQTGMTAETATIDYTISGKNLSGQDFSMTKRQSFAKARKGATGDNGESITGDEGPRGSATQRYAADLGSTARDGISSSNCAGYWNSGPSWLDNEVAGDILIITNTNVTSGWTAFYSYNGSSWVYDTEIVIHGNAVVEGSFSASKIGTGTIDADISVAAGNTLSSSGSIKAIGDTEVNTSYIRWNGDNNFLMSTISGFCNNANTTTYVPIIGDINTIGCSLLGYSTASGNVGVAGVATYHDGCGILGYSDNGIGGIFITDDPDNKNAIETVGSIYVNGDINLSEGHEFQINGVAISTPDLSDYVTDSELSTALAGYKPNFTENSGFNKAFGTGANNVAQGSHTHTGVYANYSHDHDGRYYTESEINSILSSYSLAHSHPYAPTSNPSFTGMVSAGSIDISSASAIGNAAVNSGNGLSVQGSTYGVWAAGGSCCFYAALGTDLEPFGITGSYGPFTGAHDGIIEDSLLPDIGDIVVDVAILNVATVSDVIGLNAPSTYPKQKSVFGVYIGSRKIPQEALDSLASATTYAEFYSALKENTILPTALTERLYSPLDDLSFASERDYLLAMAETHSLAMMNSVGEGCINVVSEGGNIEAGDYICSSSTPGKGMKQDDDLLHNYTVAKSRESVTWTQEEIDNNTVKMIACTYHCG
jgi:hypothetical protein